MAYFILMGRRIPKQAITGFKFQNETDNIRPFKSICKISEQVKSFINPEQIKAIAESNEPILLLSNN